LSYVHAYAVYWHVKTLMRFYKIITF
jgi:hypothetical protein